jgi:hypothetical protein
VALSQFLKGEGSVASWGDEEILASGGGDEAFQAVVAGVDIVGLLEVEGGLVAAHGGEEVGGGHEDGEVQLGLIGAIRDVEIVESGAVA